MVECLRRPGFAVRFSALLVILLTAACGVVDAPREPDDGHTGDPPPPGMFQEQYTDVNQDGLFHHCDSCLDCHDLRDMSNLALVRRSVATPHSGVRDVIFRAREGAHSYADGDSVYDGICEVCHTATAYHRNDAAGDHTHAAGENCVRCHSHEFEFAPFGGSVQSHQRHLGPELHLACGDCHADTPGLFRDGLEFALTTVCDDCHSPDGLVDGVDDPVVGGRTHWATGIYQDGTLPAGRQRWCAGCHDLGTSVIAGVAAPPVAGDGTWGYEATGHGRHGTVYCTDCHDVSAPHIDGTPHSYRAALHNYQAAFRLADVDGGAPLLVPRELGDRINPYDDPPYFDLCFRCHDRHALLGGPLAPAGPYYAPTMRTNFRNDVPMIIPDGQGTDISGYTITGVDAANSHYTHLMAGPPIFYDSDRDGTPDSYGSCVACHNVHGSSSPKMIRDGKLTGHAPGLNFAYVRYDRHDPPAGPCADPIVMTSAGVTAAESHGGIMRTDTGPDANGVCTFCHCSGSSTGDPEYIINCFGVSCVDYYRSYVETPVPPAPHP